MPGGFFESHTVPVILAMESLKFPQKNNVEKFNSNPKLKKLLLNCHV